MPKSAANRNATMHGLTTHAVLIPGESREEWQDFHAAVIDSIAPVGGLEEKLADRAAELLWRIRRVAQAEADFVNVDYEHDERAAMRHRWIAENGPGKVLRDPEFVDPSSAPTLDELAKEIGLPKDNFYAPALAAASLFPDRLPHRIIPDDKHTERIIRYEAHLSRQLHTVLNQLEAIQARRNGQHTPVARLHVSGLPGS